MRYHKYLIDTKVKILFNADHPQIEGKNGIIKSYPNIICNDYWYDVEINGKIYNCCSRQLSYC